MVGGWGTFSPSSDGAEETFPPLLGGGRRRANVGRGEDKNLNENKKIRNWYFCPVIGNVKISMIMIW